MFGFNSNTSLFSNSKRVSLNEKKYDNDLYTASFKTDLGDYELNVHLKHDKLLITCNSEIEFLSLYTYSKEITFEEFKILSNNFKSCENIEQIFTAFINILKGITFIIKGYNYNSELHINFSDEDSLTMTIKIPLIYGNYENFEIKFEKNQKSVLEQYKTLRSKYLKVKDKILYHSCSDSYYSKKEESLSTQIKKIEKEGNENNTKLFN